MKIAIFYDDLNQNFGGGEVFVISLYSLFIKNKIKTDIITFDNSEKINGLIKRKISIKTLSDHKKYRGNISLVRRKAFSMVDLRNEYDFFIFVGYDSLSASKIHKPNLYYCFTVPEANSPNKNYNNKYLSDKIWSFLFNLKNRVSSKKIPNNISLFIDKILFLAVNKSFRSIQIVKGQKNLKYHLKNIEKIISISNNIKLKINKHYNRDSQVIYPFIDYRKYSWKKSKNYWISINRIDPQKRIELQLEAFSKMPEETLYVIGNIQDKNYYDKLKRNTLGNVHFLGLINEEELLNKLSECKGLIFTAKDEDFGLVLAEAMASGKPVIAPNEGGCKETIINGKTGILIDNINEDKIIKAVKFIGKNSEKYKNECLKQAKNFDTSIFIHKLKKEINIFND